MIFESLITENQNVISTGAQGSIVTINIGGKDYALKLFKKSKSFSSIMKEAEFQLEAYNAGIAPAIYSVYQDEQSGILMEKLDETLDKIVEKQDCTLKKRQQKQLIHIFETLNRLNILHNDIKPNNIMSDMEREFENH